MDLPVQQQEDDRSATLHIIPPVSMLEPNSDNTQVGSSVTLASKSLRLCIYS